MSNEKLINLLITLKRFTNPIWPWRHLMIVVATPILLCPLLFAFDHDLELKEPMRCMYVLITMVIYWTTESIPIAATAFLPIFMYPLLGVAKSDDVAGQYFTESTMAFFGSIFVIAALEQAEIHRRFALGVLVAVGAQPRWLLAGIMAVPWFLSMWMANTMTTLLLVPLITGMVEEMRKAVEKSVPKSESTASGFSTGGETADVENGGIVVGVVNGAMEMDTFEGSGARTGTHRRLSHDPANPAPRTHRRMSSVVIGEVHAPQPVASSADLVETATRPKFDSSNLESMLLLSVAYASSIGGITTALGTAPNMILKRQVDLAFESVGCPSPLNFTAFIVFALPGSALFLFIEWVWLQVVFCGPRYTVGLAKSPYEEHEETIRRSMRQLWDQLPPMQYRQWAIGGNCLGMIILLITRQLNSNPPIGWELIAPPGFLKESAITFFVSLLLFVVPCAMPRAGARSGPLVSWKSVEKNFPIGALFLIGGGTAAAFGADKSGLADLLSRKLDVMLKPLGDHLTVFVLIAFVVIVTEVMSNTACVTLMLPIVRRLATARNRNPLVYMFPIALGSSFAFMFPVSTPPNAIVFATGRIRMTQMIGVGSVMNMLGIAVLFLGTCTWGDAYFNFFGESHGFGNGTCY